MYSVCFLFGLLFGAISCGVCVFCLFAVFVRLLVCLGLYLNVLVSLVGLLKFVGFYCGLICLLGFVCVEFVVLDLILCFYVGGFCFLNCFVLWGAIAFVDL